MDSPPPLGSSHAPERDAATPTFEAPGGATRKIGAAGPSPFDAIRALEPDLADGVATARPSTDPQSRGALVLGLLAVVGGACGAGLLFGVPAVVLGIAAHRRIDGTGADGRRGRGLASVGIGLGVLGSLLFFVWASFLLVLVVRSEVTDAAVPSSLPLDPLSRPWRAGAPTAPYRNERSEVSLHRSDGPLRTQLASAASAAEARGDTVLVVTSTPGCAACEEIDRALDEGAARAALAGVRLVRVDVSEFRSELGRLRMDEVTAPWFYLVDAHGEPRDAIDADEWDENVSENIAPVLQAFVAGRLHGRRHDWHGGATL